MEIYDHPTFRMACQQFDLVADHLQISHDERDRLRLPKRSLTVALPTTIKRCSFRFVWNAAAKRIETGRTKPQASCG